MKAKPKFRAGWMLSHGEFEVHWAKDENGRLYADKVRVRGWEFYAVPLNFGNEQRRERGAKA